jgi:hypothetical protein
VIDVSDPGNPVSVGGFGQHSRYDAYDIYVANNYVYMASEDGWLDIFDVSDPANPQLVSSTHTSMGRANDVYVVGNLAYVTGDGRRYTPGWYLDIFDISDASNPTLVGTYMMDEGYVEKVGGIYVVDNRAYVTRSGYALSPARLVPPGKLTIIDVSDPANPTLLGNLNIAGLGIEVFVVGNYAYVAEREAGLEIVDISDSSNPVSVGTCDTGGMAVGIRVAGDYAYLAVGEAGLQVIDISNPANPTPVDSYDTDGIAHELYIIGNYIYLADGSAGLKIIEFTPTTIPTMPVAAFSADITSGTAPLTVQFTDQSTGPPTQWIWYFGDGETSTEQNPSHTYTKAGSFTVSLVVTNAAGTDTETKTGFINVAAAAVPALSPWGIAVMASLFTLLLTWTLGKTRIPHYRGMGGERGSGKGPGTT